jgi:hypothetical protein
VRHRRPILDPRYVRAQVPEGGPLAGWRRRILIRAGFPEPLAIRVAADPRSDVLALLALVDRGCPPVTAVRILALDDSPLT